MQQLYSLFDPVNGEKRLEQQNLTPDEIDPNGYNFKLSHNLNSKCCKIIVNMMSIRRVTSSDYRMVLFSSSNNES